MTYGVFTPEGELTQIGRSAYDARINWERDNPRRDFDADAKRDGLKIEPFNAVRE